MNVHEAGAHALVLRVISVAPDATPQMRAMATRFTQRYEAYRDEGISHDAAYVMARAETEAYLLELNREGVFA